MKIAIQGHVTRRKDVIKILKSIGGINKLHFNSSVPYAYYYVNENNCIDLKHINDINTQQYKLYTLEEFEKEFPFKIGDIVQTVPNGQAGIITELCPDPIFVLAYKIRYNSKRELLFPAQILKLYKPMKEERNITLTLEKAKEWYNKGGELKEIALQAFTERELSPLPKSWDEYCKMYPVQSIKCMAMAGCPEKYIALWKLEQLCNCYRQGWKPDWKNEHTSKHCITLSSNTLWITQRAVAAKFLSFQSKEVAEEFLNNFEHLIKVAGDLI